MLLAMCRMKLDKLEFCCCFRCSEVELFCKMSSQVDDNGEDEFSDDDDGSDGEDGEDSDWLTDDEQLV